MPDLLFFLLLGHFLGDFALQTGRMAKLKPTSFRILTEHVTIYTTTLAGSLFVGLTLNGHGHLFATWTTLMVMLFVFAGHLIQDRIKGARFSTVTQAFFIDQALHIIILYLMRIWIYNV